MSTLSFPWPNLRGQHTAIVPIFLPFAGCRVRCIYCAQNLQTGKTAGTFNLHDTLTAASNMLALRRTKNLPPAEAAFFGGTFTGQDQSALNACLDAAGEWLHSGLISSWRCSTRPDTLAPALLSKMRSIGCRAIELGIQSFETHVLSKSRRGYTAETARHAVDTVLHAGLTCGIQLLPGLPDSTSKGFLNDILTGIRLGASFFRFYPCLVLQTTALAELYKQKLYQPWSLKKTVESLAQGFLLTQQAQVPVIRIGIANEPALLQSILAGPWDPQLGTSVMGKALLLKLRQLIPFGEKPVRIVCPRFVQGYMFGQHGEYQQALTAMGINKQNLFFHQRENIEFFLQQSVKQ